MYSSTIGECTPTYRETLLKVIILRWDDDKSSIRHSFGSTKSKGSTDRLDISQNRLERKEMWEKEDHVTCTGLCFAMPGSTKHTLTRDAPDFIQT